MCKGIVKESIGLRRFQWNVLCLPLGMCKGIVKESIGLRRFRWNVLLGTNVIMNETKKNEIEIKAAKQ